LTLNLARKKAQEEWGWSAAIILIMVMGLTGWIVVPAIGQSLESGFTSYANQAGTYVVVESNGNGFGQDKFISNDTIAQIASITGVQNVYPVAVNITNFYFPNYSSNPPPGSNGPIVRGMTVAYSSAVMGGPLGFPVNFVDLTAGQVPTAAEPEFIINILPFPDFDNNMRPFAIGEAASVSISGVDLTATAAGINSYNPLMAGIADVLWNATLVRNQLGEKLYDQTFSKVSSMIIKVTTVGKVASVTEQITNAMTAYPDYLVTYDQSGVTDLLSVESSTAPLYNIIGVVSLVSLISALFIVSYIAVKRRSWEAGLLVSQGWTWNRVTAFFWQYFVILAVTSWLLSILLSMAVSPYATFSYQVYGSVLQIKTSIGLFSYASAGLIAVAMTAAVSLFMKWKLRKIGLDSILREY